MKLEVGKKYLTRDGRIAFVCEINLNNLRTDQALGIIYRDDTTSYLRSWDITGRYWGDSIEDAKDLVSEHKEPEEIPLSFDDAELIMSKGWVRHKSSGRIRIVTSMNIDDICIEGYRHSYQDLKEYFTWVDGTPCGKLKQ